MELIIFFLEEYSTQILRSEMKTNKKPKANLTHLGAFIFQEPASPEAIALRRFS